MWMVNLNRHFAKISKGLKISTFLFLWNSLFHSFTLSILLYWSMTSTQIPALFRMTSLNQFLSENQIFFATLSSLSALFFFKNAFLEIWQLRSELFPEFSRSCLRGFGFGGLMLWFLTLGHHYQYLGFSSQLDLNFLTSYAWILRTLLLFLFVTSTELLVRVVLKNTLPLGILSILIQNFTLILIYWIWFNPKPTEQITLLLLFALFSSPAASIGFLSALFILVHAICGLNFFENEFVGLLQFKILAPNEESFFQNFTLQIVLGILLLLLGYGRLKSRKESTLA